MTATDLVKRPLGGARVLVAEGDADGSVALTVVLRLNGFDAREARTAEAALRATSETRPAVVVVDLDLPDGDGCALIRRVRRLPNPPAVVVVTGHAAEGARRAATEAGAVAYLLKPADPSELARLIGRLSDGRGG
jgi:DNA-binding response OmpR family regulator